MHVVISTIVCTRLSYVINSYLTLQGKITLLAICVCNIKGKIKGVLH